MWPDVESEYCCERVSVLCKKNWNYSRDITNLNQQTDKQKVGTTT